MAGSHPGHSVPFTPRRSPAGEGHNQGFPEDPAYLRAREGLQGDGSRTGIDGQDVAQPSEGEYRFHSFYRTPIADPPTVDVEDPIQHREVARQLLCIAGAAIPGFLAPDVPGDGLDGMDRRPGSPLAGETTQHVPSFAIHQGDEARTLK